MISNFFDKIFLTEKIKILGMKIKNLKYVKVVKNFKLNSFVMTTSHITSIANIVTGETRKMCDLASS